jgi:hypothetical protein
MAEAILESNDVALSWMRRKRLPKSPCVIQAGTH